MNRNKNRRNQNNENTKQKRVIRCKTLNRPVFGHEICTQFCSKSNPNTTKNCENCRNSF
jgi:hypothetical protein